VLREKPAGAFRQNDELMEMLKMVTDKTVSTSNEADETEAQMSDEVVKKSPQMLDGFDGYEDSVEGAEQQNRIIQGSLMKFTNEATWVSGDEELPVDLELVAVNVSRIVQKWKDRLPVETIVLEPGQKFPDLKKLNADVPQDEWEEGPEGKLRGPWQAQYLVYLVDLKTSMDRFTYATGTTGGGIAVRDLVDRTDLMRRFRGSRIYPVVRLSDTFMPTRYGGRQRPHFNIVRWVMLDGGGQALPAAELPAIAGPPTVPEVKPPSAKEVTDDEIKF
jgi:hypothetical protein